MWRRIAIPVLALFGATAWAGRRAGAVGLGGPVAQRAAGREARA
jgi:hypothetical protein